mgnify:CR=1 FL=1
MVVSEFSRQRTLARTWKQNQDLVAIKVPARATTEQYELFARYQQSRHAGSDMAEAMAQTIGERGGFSPVVIKGADDLIGVVTVHDGASLPQGQIIAPVVGDDPTQLRTYHNNFQDPEAFLAAGGLRGRQLQVLVEGTYYINRLFATVELIAKTIVEVGHVGVVVSYTGAHGADLSGTEYKHGELVRVGERGVWNEPLLPGKYAFNMYAGKVIMVPTTNFILKWTRAEVGAHRFDELGQRAAQH